MLSKPHVALLVACPSCGAKIGDECRGTSPIVTAWATYPHQARVDKFEKFVRE